MPSPFLTDTFTDTTGTVLTAHTPDTGGSWTFSTATAANGLVITAAGRLRNNAAAQSVATSSVATTGNPSTLTWDLIPVTTATGFIGVGVGAPSATSLQGYEARYDLNSGNWQIIGFNSGSFAILGTAAMTLTAGTTYHCQFVVPDPASSGTKTLYVNGASVLSVTNTTYPTSGHVYFDTASTAAPTDSPACKSITSMSTTPLSPPVPPPPYRRTLPASCSPPAINLSSPRQAWNGSTPQPAPNLILLAPPWR